MGSEMLFFSVIQIFLNKHILHVFGKNHYKHFNDEWKPIKIYFMKRNVI